MESVKNLSVNVNYELQDTHDDRFLRMKIYVMHDKLNLNNSYFSMDAIERAKESINNIPILAFTRTIDGEDSKDFGGHEMEFIIEDGDIKYRYLGRPIGVIPSIGNNYHYENIEDKTFVVVDGYVWTNYANEALDIIKRDQVKRQSMEIAVDSFHFNNEGVLEITDYRYTGLCLLGDDVQEAMVGAKAELINTYSFNNEFFQMVDELKNVLNNSFTDEGGIDEMTEEKVGIVEVADEEQVTEDVFEQTSETVEETTEGNLEETAEEVANDSDNFKNENVEISEKDGCECSDNDCNCENEFQLKYEELQKEYEKLQSEFATLKTELEELRNFKSTKLAEERKAKEDELYNQFSTELTENEISEVKKIASELTLEELEEKLFTLVGKKKAKFATKSKKNETVKIPFDIEEKPKQWYGGLFEKYLNK